MTEFHLSFQLSIFFSLKMKKNLIEIPEMTNQQEEIL